ATWLLDQDVVLDDLFELIDPRLHETLLVLGGVVFEVLGEVAELAGGLDLGSDRGTPHADELLVLLAYGLEALGSDVNVLSHHFESKPMPFLYSPRHEKAAAHGFHAPHGDGARRRRRRIAGWNVPGPAGPGGRHPRLGGWGRAGHRPYGGCGQPLGQRGMGPRRHPVRLRGARVRGGLAVHPARRVPSGPSLLRAGLQPAADRALPAAQSSTTGDHGESRQTSPFPTGRACACARDEDST